jgi:transposase
MQSMTAPADPVTVGVDTHRDVHVAAVIDQTGRLLATEAFPASTRGYVGLVTWAERFGRVARIGVEGTGTYGAGLARFVRAYGLQVVEVDRPDRSMRRRRGKSDPIDAQAAARATLAGVATTTPKTREGQVEMIRVLRVARRGAMKARVAAAEQLYGVLYSAPEELRAPLLGLKTKALVGACAAMRPGPLTSTTAATKAALRVLARRWQQLQAELTQLDAQLQELVAAVAPTLVALPGVGVDTAGQLLVTAGDNPQRLRGEAAFAHLCGVAPIPRVLGPHRPSPAQPRRRPPRQQRPVAHRSGPHALPPADQGLRAAAHQARPVQAGHHALLEALHRPRGLPPPHKSATQRCRRLPEIGGIKRNGCSAGRCGTPACFAHVPHCRIAGRAGYRSWLLIVLVVIAVSHHKFGPAPRPRSRHVDRR